MRAITFAGACLFLSGCAMLDHSNTLIFATNTNLGIQAGTDATNVPTINIGYRRQEGVIMPLLANLRDSTNRRTPCFVSVPETVRDPPVNATSLTAPAECKFVAKNSLGNLEDAYSVLASFGANFSAQAGPGAEGRGGLAQYFATGAAAQFLAITGGAAVVAVGMAAEASAAQPNSQALVAALTRDADFIPGLPPIEEISARVMTLTDNQAVLLARAMEPNLATRSPQIQELVRDSDPENMRLTNGTVAKEIIDRWLIFDNRDAATIKQWNDAIAAVIAMPPAAGGETPRPALPMSLPAPPMPLPPPPIP